ncbi:hypothetical protein RUM43_001199 [Polyplax serrata]|uniref:phosphatidylserine decarboxylase n=1 Tax=Polyplax serrata TaxID=468196 RepID=A0AAN8SDG2_POLSC
MSRLWGAVTNIDLPVFIRPKIYSLYANSFGVNLDECAIQDLTRYRSLSEFFIRPLKEECRPINSDCKCVVSPADGRVLTFGKVTSCQVDQVKGVTYSLQQFLGKQSWRKTNNQSSSKAPNRSNSSTSNFKEGNWSTDEEQSDEESAKLSVTGFPGCTFEPAEAVSNLPSGEYLERLKEKNDTELYQCVVYLAPGDYHRFHSPVSWKVKFRRHFQGKLLSVNPVVASWINNLFSLNERAVYVGSWKHGFFSLTAVGATNVGYIRVVFDPSLHTNRWIVTPRERDLFFTKDLRTAETERKVSFKRPVEIEKGQLFGEFRLGSTIVLIFEAPKNFRFDIEKGQKIKYGEKIGSYRGT